MNNQKIKLKLDIFIEYIVSKKDKESTPNNIWIQGIYMFWKRGYRVYNTECMKESFHSLEELVDYNMMI